MKRMISLFACLTILLSLFGCTAAPAGTVEPMPTVPAVSDQETVVYPQKGEYQEAQLLANVPSQNTPLLLSVRSDGSVDYIYAEQTAFSDGPVRHYVIAPDGTAQRQEDGWMAQLNDYTTEVTAAAALEHGRWRYLLTAEDGVILILAQFHDIVSTVKNNGNFDNTGEIRHTALFKLEDGTLSKIPMDYGTQRLDRAYISSITLEGGEIGMKINASPYYEPRNWAIRHALDGTLLETEELPPEDYLLDGFTLVDGDGLILHTWQKPEEAPPEYMILRSMYETFGESFGPEEQPHTDDDSLYLLGQKLGTLELTAFGPDGTFYCWFRELRGGRLVRYQPNPDGKQEPEAATVWSLEPIPLIETAVAQWNATHASPIFRYETAQGDREEALTRLRLELAIGKGPDVLILDGYYTEGLLDFLTPLDALDLSGVYKNLLDPFTVDGEVLALPVRMEPYLLARDPEKSQEVGSLRSFADVITSTKELDMGSNSAGLLYYDAMYNIDDCTQLFQLWYPAWADAIWEGGRYHADVFREFLTQLGRLTGHYHLDVPLWYQDPEGFAPEPILNATDGPMYGNSQSYRLPYVLAATSHVGLYAYWWYDDGVGLEPQSNPCILAGIPGPDGTGAAAARIIAGVRSGGSESVGLAFLQLLLTDELQVGAGYYDPAQADGYPVKWSCTELLLERMEDYMNCPFATENDYRQVLSNLRGVAMDDMLYQAALDAAMAYLRSAPTDFEQQSGLRREMLTLEEAVAQLDETTRIYLAEGN